MFESIKNFFRDKRLKTDASDTPTGFIPLEQIKTADVVIDVEEPGFDQLKEDILAWGRNNRIKVNIFFIDFRKLGKDELLMTSIQTTIIKKELNWYGLPPKEKVSMLTEGLHDLYISMLDNTDFTADYLSKCSKAKFKIGRHSYTGNPFDFVLTTGQTGENLKADLRSNSREVFAAIADLLTKIS